MVLMPDDVSAPAVRPPRHNLVGSANLPALGQDKWENGVTFSPRGCYEVTGACSTCPPANMDELQDCIDPLAFGPYLLDLGVSLYAPDREQVSADAEDDLDNGSSSRLESLIWSGCAGVDNPLLSDGTSLGSATAPLYALGRMAAELISATGHGGAQGTIHMSPTIAVPLSEHFVEIDGVLRTKVGYHTVVVGNYPATHIAGHVGEIDVYLGSPFQAKGKDQLMRFNKTELRWSRVALAAWNACATFTQAVDLTGGIDGGSP